MTREQMIVYMNLLDESFIVEASPANTHKFIVHKKKQIYQFAAFAASFVLIIGVLLMIPHLHWNDPVTPIQTDTTQLHTALISDTSIYSSESSDIASPPIQTGQDSIGANWSETGGGNPFTPLYVYAVSGFTIADGTFGNVSTYYDEENQNKFYSLLENYREKTAGIPLIVHIIREMGLTKSEYIHYLDTIKEVYTNELVDILFSDDNDLINETFHSPLTLYHNGTIYTLYDLAEIDQSSNLDQFPNDKLEQLYYNIHTFCEEHQTELPPETVDVFNKIKALSADSTAD